MTDQPHDTEARNLIESIARPFPPDCDWEDQARACQAVAVQVLAALARSDSARVEIPAGMVPWHGGDSAPEDWDGGQAFQRDGRTLYQDPKGFDWRHFGPETSDGDTDIIAYTPKPIASGGGEREAMQREREEVEIADNAVNFVFDQLADKLGLAEWRVVEGSEEWEGDVSATLHALLIDAGIIDDETGAVATLAQPAREAIADDAESEAAACRHAQANATSDTDKLYRMGQKDALLLFASRVRDPNLILASDSAKATREDEA